MANDKNEEITEGMPGDIPDTVDAVEKSADASMQALLEIEQEDILLLDIGGRQMLLRAAEVSEIIKPLPMTPVPMGPEHLLGLANVRGQIVCMIDASKVMQLPPICRDITPHTRFVILRHAKMHAGIWVDRVHALYRVNRNQIPEPTKVAASEPSCGNMEIEGKRYEMFNCAGLFQ